MDDKNDKKYDQVAEAIIISKGYCAEIGIKGEI